MGVTNHTPRTGPACTQATATLTTARRWSQQDRALAATSPGRARPGATRHPANPAHRNPHRPYAGLGSTVDSALGSTSATTGQRSEQHLPATLTHMATNRCLLNEQDPDTIATASAHLIRSEEGSRQRTNRIGILLNNRSSISTTAPPIDAFATGYRRNVISLITNGSAGPEADINRLEDVNSRPPAPVAVRRVGGTTRLDVRVVA